MKDKKNFNLICVFLVLTVVLSAAIVSSYAIFRASENPTGTPPPTSSSRKEKPQKENTPEFSLSDLNGLLNLNGALGLSSFFPGNSNFNVYNVKSTETGHMYFKIKSFGDYNGSNEWGEATEYVSKIDSTHSAIYLPASLIETGNMSPSCVEIESSLDQYILPYYPSISQNNHIQESDVICAGDASSTYTVYFYSENTLNNFIKDTILNDKYEQEYRSFVYSNYLGVDPETSEYMSKLIETYGFYGNDPQIIEKVADFISKSAKYDLLYDRTLDSEDNVAIAFLENYKTGICQHYATAATLLFRSLGIPARYTVGFAADTVADRWVQIKSEEAHAWVEVYIDGVGWTYVEVTGGRVDNTFESIGDETTDGVPSSDETNWETPYESASEPEIPPTTLPPETPHVSETVVSPSTRPPRPPETSFTWVTSSEKAPATTEVPKQLLIISPINVEKKYDGEPLYVTDEINGFDEYAEKGYTYKAYIVGGRTEPGKSSSVIESIVIFDSNGTDVTENFNIVRRQGVVHVYIKELLALSDGAEKIYDGTPLTNQSAFLATSLDYENYYYTLTVTGSQTNVGTGNNAFVLNIFDESHNNITDNYKIMALYGKLTVTPAEITLKADDASRVYDGLPLVCNSFALIGDLAQGDEIVSCIVSGSQTEIGRSENIIDANSIKIQNQNGEDVTGNYAIKLIAGTLRVTP